jgi:hypothetical protein
MRTRHVAAFLATIALVAGCSSGSDDKIGPTDPTSGNGTGSFPSTPDGVGAFKAVFVAGSGIWPYPFDLHFLGSTDGTLNISSSFSVFPQRASMNQLDGWSTTASSYFRFSQPLKNDPAVLNSSVRIIRVQTFRDPTTGVYAPTANVLGVLQPGVDYAVRVSPDLDTGGTYAEIEWLKPLAASAGTGLANGYIVLITNGMLNNSDVPATPDTDYLNIRTEAVTEIGRAIASGNPATFVPTCPGITNPTLNSICKLTYAHLLIGSNPALGPAAINPANVILSYHFTTQSTRDPLVALSQTNVAQPISVIPTPFTTANLLPGVPGIADVFVGTLQVPYFLSPPSAQDPTAPLTKTWLAAGAPSDAALDPNSRFITRFNLTPEKKADLKIPLLVTKPNGNSPSGGVKPANGWPIVLFMHGLGGNRTNAVPIADTYASQGFVVIAMDQVLHGITDTTSPLYAGPGNPSSDLIYGPGVRERTFDVDYVNNVTGASGPDGVIDQSGRHVITIALTAPLVGRDTFRQSGSDMITLVKSLANLDLDGDGQGDIDMDQIHYGGISLGGIVGPACVCSEMKSYYLNVPGGPLPTILRTSPSFSALVNGALAAANPLLIPGTALYTQFFREAQAAIDGGDPVNYVKQLGMDRPVLFTKVIGDTVVPNGTNDFIIGAAGATKITQAGLNPVAAGAPKFVTFLSGSHSSLLDPTSSLAVTQEMQTHAASFVATGGAAIQVVDSSLLEQ